MLRPRAAGRYPQTPASGRRRATTGAYPRPRSNDQTDARAGLDVLALLFAAAVAVHVVGLISLLTGWLDPLFNDAVNRLGQGADFFAVYGAGHNLLDGKSVYAPAEGGVPYAYPFRYLPSVGYSLGALFNIT
ncbi:MAG: hypothetical protein AB7G38_02980, partial [Dehalococcoidia bacterium]